MKKILTLVFVLLLAAGSAAGYQIINAKIIDGEARVAAGKKLIAAGEKKLASGKARLKSGEKRLAKGKKLQKNIKTVTKLPLVPDAINNLVVPTKMLNKTIDDKIADGDRQVAAGKKKIAAGEKRLKAGKSQLKMGIEKLRKAKIVRDSLGIAAIALTALFILLTLYWRRSLFASFRRK